MPSCVNSHSVNKCPSCDLFSATLFSAPPTPQCSAEVLSKFLLAGRLSHVIRGKYVLDKLCSVMSYGAVGHEFSVNESTIYTI